MKTAEHVADLVRRTTVLAIGERANLYALARHLGVVSVIENIEGRSTTRWCKNGPVIALDHSTSGNRRRMTFAHELGHVVVDPLTAPERCSLVHPSWLQHRQEQFPMARETGEEWMHLTQQIGLERLCDFIGHELLMPAHLMVGSRDFATGLTQIQALARRWAVSVPMLVLRLNELRNSSQTDLVAVTARLGHQGWRVTSSVGVPRQPSETLILYGKTTLANIEGSPQQIVRRTLRLNVTGCKPRTMSGDFDLLREGTTLVAVARKSDLGS